MTLQWPAYIAVCCCKKKMENKLNLLISRWFLQCYFSNPCTVWAQSSPEDLGLPCSPGAVSAPVPSGGPCRAVPWPWEDAGGSARHCQAWLGEQDWQKAFSFLCSPFWTGSCCMCAECRGLQTFALAQVELQVFSEQQHESEEWSTANSHCCCLPVASASNYSQHTLNTWQSL